MTGPYIDKSELEETVQSSPYGTAFVSPIVTAHETQWSFLIHESRDVGDSLEKETASMEAGAPPLSARCVLITISSDGAAIPIISFLFRLRTDPPTVYSLFMNPTGNPERELLDDLCKQEELILDFHDEHHLARIKRTNNLRGCITDALASIDEGVPVTEEMFDIALDTLVSETFDSDSLWALFE